MDVISHGLVGAMFQAPLRNLTRKHRVLVTSFAVIPDLPVAFVYLLLGHKKERPFWIPHNSDWVGVREAHPVWSAMWEIPHSMLFLLLVVIPLVLLLRLPWVSILAYASHIFLDLWTHTGEWALKPVYPIDWTVEGFTDAWAWPLRHMVVSWAILLVALLGVRQGSNVWHLRRARKGKGTPP